MSYEPKTSFITPECVPSKVQWLLCIMAIRPIQQRPKSRMIWEIRHGHINIVVISNACGRGANFPLILRRLLDSICGTLHERFNKLFCSTRTTSDQVKWTHYRAGGGRWMALIRHQVYTPFSSSIESPPLFCLSLHKLQHLLILSESSSNHAFHVSTRASSTWGHRDAAQGWPGLHVGSRPALQLSHVGRGVQIISIHGLEAAVTPIKTSLGHWLFIKVYFLTVRGRRRGRRPSWYHCSRRRGPSLSPGTTGTSQSCPLWPSSLRRLSS